MSLAAKLTIIYKLPKKMKEIFEKMWRIVKIVAVFVWKLWKCVVMTAEFCLCWAFVAAACLLELAVGGWRMEGARGLAMEMPGAAELAREIRDVLLE